ncbi:MAG: hypothetical protein Q8M16_15190 [Pirellulaceae bacterium]|nr:hypothetical protein [Pirellulaceae bacterium]
MAAQGETNFWIDKGTLGEVVWRNDVGFNHSSPGNEIIQEPHVGWLRWDNSTQNAFANWACTEGIGDVRIPLGMAEMHPVGCAVVPGLHLVGGVSCKKLESIGFRIFVDAANPHRLIRVEIDRAGLGGGLAHAADFLNWQDFGLGEYPTLINSTQFNHDPVVGDSVWTYSFSNIQVNANLPAGLFDLEFQ